MSPTWSRMYLTVSVSLSLKDEIRYDSPQSLTFQDVQEIPIVTPRTFVLLLKHPGRLLMNRSIKIPSNRQQSTRIFLMSKILSEWTSLCMKLLHGHAWTRSATLRRVTGVIFMQVQATVENKAIASARNGSSHCSVEH